MSHVWVIERMTFGKWTPVETYFKRETARIFCRNFNKNYASDFRVKKYVRAD